jgi:hypothetical protein
MIKVSVAAARSGVPPSTRPEARGVGAKQPLTELVARSVGHASNHSIARLVLEPGVRRLLRVATGGGLGGAAPQDVAQVASDFLREKLGQGAVRQGSDMENMLRKIARRNPGLAQRATGLADQLRAAKVGAQADLDDLTARGRGLAQRAGVTGQGTPRKVEDALRNVARQGGQHAQEASELADQIRQARGRLNELAQGVPAQYRAPTLKPPPTSGQAGTPHGDKHAGKPDKPGSPVSKPAESPTPARKPQHPPAAAKPPPAPTKPPTTPSPTTGGKVATEVAEDALKRRKVFMRVARAIPKLIDGLVPDPTDAIELMIQYAQAFEAARAAVRKRNLERGFAIGWAAYLVIPRWEWAMYFADTYVDKGVITQVIDAVGVAENAFNEGLVRGFIYGEKHTQAQLDGARQRAFEAIHRSGQTVGRDIGDDVYQFGRDDVYTFAGALLPAAVAVIAKAEQRKEIREERERLEREAQKAREDYEAGHAPAGARWE